MSWNKKQQRRQFSSGIERPTMPSVPYSIEEVEALEASAKQSNKQVKWFERVLKAWSRNLLNNAKMHRQFRQGQKVDMAADLIERTADTGLRVAESKTNQANQLIGHQESEQLSLAEQRFNEVSSARNSVMCTQIFDSLSTYSHRW